MIATAKKEIHSTNDGDTGSPPEGKGLIIEFVGPTGSGKTTNCFYFSEVLKKQNLNAYVFTDVKKYFYALKFHHRLMIVLSSLISNGRNFLSYIILLAGHGIYSFDSIYRYGKLCIYNTVLHQFISIRKADVVLLDQWTIQGLWSATIFKARSCNDLQDRLKPFYFQTDYALYFDIDVETACERIGARNSGRSRFDLMDKEKRLSELKRYNHYLLRLYENSTCKNKFSFSTKVSPVKNAEDFLHHLKHPATREL